jgi:hypothetical protein
MRRLGCERGSTGSRGTGVGCSARNRSGFWWLPGAGALGGTTAGGGWSRSRSCDIDQRVPLVLPELLPEVPDVLPEPDVPEPDVPDEPVDPVPLLLELDPEPVSVLGEVALTDPDIEPDAVVDEVVSLVVDDVVGEVELVVAVELGVALEPVLLDEVLAPCLQPARAELASAMAAMYGIRRFMTAPFLSALRLARAPRVARDDFECDSCSPEEFHLRHHERRFQATGLGTLAPHGPNLA